MISLTDAVSVPIPRPLPDNASPFGLRIYDGGPLDGFSGARSGHRCTTTVDQPRSVGGVFSPLQCFVQHVRRVLSRQARPDIDEPYVDLTVPKVRQTTRQRSTTGWNLPLGRRYVQLSLRQRRTLAIL